VLGGPYVALGPEVAQACSIESRRVSQGNFFSFLNSEFNAFDFENKKIMFDS